MMLSGRGSPDATLWGNFQPLPLAPGNVVAGAALSLQPIRPPVATETEKNPAYFKKFLLSKLVSL
jgi:hypothetical protein